MTLPSTPRPVRFGRRGFRGVSTPTSDDNLAKLEIFKHSLRRELPGEHNVSARACLRAQARAWFDGRTDANDFRQAIALVADKIAFTTEGRTAVARAIDAVEKATHGVGKFEEIQTALAQRAIVLSLVDDIRNGEHTKGQS